MTKPSDMQWSGQWSEPLKHRVHVAVSLKPSDPAQTSAQTSWHSKSSQNFWRKHSSSLQFLHSREHWWGEGRRQCPSTCLWFQLHCHYSTSIHFYVENRQASKSYRSPHFSHHLPKSGFELQDKVACLSLSSLFLLPAWSFLPLTPHWGWQAADTTSWTQAPTQESHCLKILGQNSETQRRRLRPPLVSLDSILYSSFALPKYKENQDRWLQDASTKYLLRASDEQTRSAETSKVIFL